jgi:hypothetical protein
MSDVHPGSATILVALQSGRDARAPRKEPPYWGAYFNVLGGQCLSTRELTSPGVGEKLQEVGNSHAAAQTESSAQRFSSTPAVTRRRTLLSVLAESPAGGGRM